MKKRKLFTVIRIFGLLAIILTLTLSTTTPVNSEPIVLKAVSWTNPTRAKLFGLDWIRDRIYAKSGGRIKIEYLGGSDVIPQREQFAALQNGVIDFLWTYAAIYSAQLPEFHLIHLAELDEAGRLAPGAMQWLNQLHAKLNVRWMGAVKYYDPWYIGTSKKKPKNLKEVQSLIINQTSVPHQEMAKLLGARVVDSTTEEQHGILDRGLADAAGFSVTYWSTGLPEIIKYIILPSYKSNNNVSTYMNLKVWNNLTPELQKIWTEVMESVMADGVRRDLGSAQLEKEVWLAAGCEFISPFTPKEAKWYASLYDKVNWKQLNTKAAPENVKKVESFINHPKGVRLMPRP